MKMKTSKSQVVTPPGRVIARTLYDPIDEFHDLSPPEPHRGIRGHIHPKLLTAQQLQLHMEQWDFDAACHEL